MSGRRNLDGQKYNTVADFKADLLTNFRDAEGVYIKFDGIGAEFHLIEGNFSDDNSATDCSVIDHPSTTSAGRWMRRTSSYKLAGSPFAFSLPVDLLRTQRLDDETAQFTAPGLLAHQRFTLVILTALPQGVDVIYGHAQVAGVAVDGIVQLGINNTSEDTLPAATVIDLEVWIQD